MILGGLIAVARSVGTIASHKLVMSTVFAYLTLLNQGDFGRISQGIVPMRNQDL